jgi:beta-phosphoglucomutase-like phosphatase (HAD superfamily)
MNSSPDVSSPEMARFLGLEGVDAVVFDCDGVLVDSEPLSERAWRQALEEHGVDMGQDFSQWVGTTDDAIAIRFAAEAGVSPTRLADRAAAILVDDLRYEPAVVFDDARNALAGAQAAELRLAVATNSERWRLEALLRSAGIADVFEFAVTSDDVRSPKPAPDVYLLAASLLGVEPPRCLVVEDSPTGVAAARAAGMRVVAVDRGVFDPVLLAPATRIVYSIHEASLT